MRSPALLQGFAKCATPKTLIALEKPPFPDMEGKQHLEDFVTHESWALFDLLGGNCDWLRQNPETWDADNHYLEAKDIVHNLYGVNDPAERMCLNAKRYKVKQRHVNNTYIIYLNL
jgi:hypothetical protein